MDEAKGWFEECKTVGMEKRASLLLRGSVEGVHSRVMGEVIDYLMYHI